MGTVIWRRDQDDFNERWWELYMHCGVRDQLSMAVALPLEYGSSPCRDFVNQFSDAEPEGVWWQTKSGSYQYCDKKDPDDFVNRLCEMTGLRKSFRYRAAIFNPKNALGTKTGDLILGYRGKYWPKDYYRLNVLSGRRNH
jgi:hypothetical protein